MRSYSLIFDYYIFMTCKSGKLQPFINATYFKNFTLIYVLNNADVQVAMDKILHNSDHVRGC